MDEEIKRLLDEEIKSEIADLYNLAPGSEEQSAAIDNLVKLYKLRIEETRNELDCNEKKEQLAAQVIDRYFRLGV